MAHRDCPICGATIDGDTSILDRLMREHTEREHRQGYRPSSSWRTCSVCGGSGKNTWGGICSSCNGAGKV